MFKSLNNAITGLLALVAIIANTVVLASAYSNTLSLSVAAVASLVALLYGAYYIEKGATKEVSDYYKTYVLMFIVSNVAALYYSATVGIYKAFAVALNILILLPLLVLYFKKDLGKKNSFICVYIVLAIISFIFVSSIINFATNANTDEIIYIARGVSQEALAVVLLNFVTRKYKDKATRNTK